jgi:hypothetical protein
MTDHDSRMAAQDDAERPQGSTPQDDAARLGLAMVGEATAMTVGDEEAFRVSEENLRDVVDELIDEPLTPRQEEVVETIGAMGASLTAGLSSALAHAQDRDPSEVLGGAAASIVWQQHIAATHGQDSVEEHHAADDGEGGTHPGPASIRPADER